MSEGTSSTKSPADGLPVSPKNGDRKNSGEIVDEATEVVGGVGADELQERLWATVLSLETGQTTLDRNKVNY